LKQYNALWWFDLKQVLVLLLASLLLFGCVSSGEPAPAAEANPSLGPIAAATEQATIEATEEPTTLPSIAKPDAPEYNPSIKLGLIPEYSVLSQENSVEFSVLFKAAEFSEGEVLLLDNGVEYDSIEIEFGAEEEELSFNWIALYDGGHEMEVVARVLYADGSIASETKQAFTAYTYPIENKASSPSDDELNNGEILAQRFTLDNPVTVTKVKVQLKGSLGVEATVFVAVARDEGGEPGELVASMEVSSLHEFNYNWIELGVNLELESGPYWIIVNSPEAGSISWAVNTAPFDLNTRALRFSEVTQWAESKQDHCFEVTAN
jgi:hypothetical protein